MLDNTARTIGLRYQLRVIRAFASRAFRLWSYFRLSFLLDLLNVGVSFTVFAVVASLGEPDVAIYGTRYETFLVVGIAANTIMAAAISAPYNGLMSSWWDNRLETLLMSPVSLPIFITGISIGDHIKAMIRVSMYVVGGYLVFGAFRNEMLDPSAALLGAAILLGFVACTGLGLAAASMVYLIDARGGSDPVRLVVEALAGITAGVYFPITVLPRWLRGLSMFLPHTYVVDAIRRALSGWGGSVPTLAFHHLLPAMKPITVNLLVLAVYAVLTMLLGGWLLKRGLSLARADGRLSKWR